MTKELETLAELSAFYGNSVDWVQAAGGNTSAKLKDRIFIKKSGIRLREVTASEGFIGLNLPRKWIEKVCTSSVIEIERVYRELINSLLPDKNVKPSIELSFHTLGQKYTVHTHSTLVNIFGCSVEGSKLLETLFLHKEIMLIPYVKPGIILTRNILIALKDRKSLPEITVLLSHGLVVTADTPELIHKNTDDLMHLLSEVVVPEETPFNTSALVTKALQELFPETHIREVVDENLGLYHEYNGKILYPDMAVYCGKSVCFFDENSRYEKQLQKFRTEQEAEPKIISIKDRFYVLGRNPNELEFISEVLSNHAKVLKHILKMKWTPVFLNQVQIEELLDWDLEKYRQELLKNPAR